MVASQLAAGEGLNLQTCSDCVMHERQWNPGKEEQAEGRFIRIGQTARQCQRSLRAHEGTYCDRSSLDAISGKKEDSIPLSHE